VQTAQSYSTNTRQRRAGNNSRQVCIYNMTRKDTLTRIHRIKWPYLHTWINSSSTNAFHKALSALIWVNSVNVARHSIQQTDMRWHVTKVQWICHRMQDANRIYQLRLIGLGFKFYRHTHIVTSSNNLINCTWSKFTTPTNRRMNPYLVTTAQSLGLSYSVESDTKHWITKQCASQNVCEGQPVGRSANAIINSTSAASDQDQRGGHRPHSYLALTSRLSTAINQLVRTQNSIHRQTDRQTDKSNRDNSHLNQQHLNSPSLTTTCFARL